MNDTDSVAVWSWIERSLLGQAVEFRLLAIGPDIHLEANGRQWSLGDSMLRLSCVPKRVPVISTFTVSRGDTVEYSLTFWHVLRTIAGKLDWTYDKLDFDADYPLYALSDSYSSSEWRAHMDARRRGGASAA